MLQQIVFPAFKKKTRGRTKRFARASLGVWPSPTPLNLISVRKMITFNLTSLSWLITNKEKSELAGKILQQPSTKQSWITNVLIIGMLFVFLFVLLTASVHPRLLLWEWGWVHTSFTNKRAVENVDKTFLELEIKLCWVFKQKHVYSQFIKPLANINFPEITRRHFTSEVIAFHSFAFWWNQSMIGIPNKNNIAV